MRYWVLFLLCVGTVVAYVQRTAISVPADTIRDALALGTAQMGVVMGAWYAGYAVFQLPAGWLADRVGSTPTLVVSCLLWSYLTGSVAEVAGYFDLCGLWFLMGVAQAGIFPCITKAIGGWFPTFGRAFASGSVVVAQTFGAALAAWLTGQLLGPLGWRDIFFLYAIPGVAWAVGFLLLTPSQPPGRRAAAAGPVNWGRLFGSGSMQLLAAQQFLRGAAMAFFFTWFPVFLQQRGGLTKAEAGEWTAVPVLGAMVGGLLGGVSSELVLWLTGNKRLSRQGVAVVGMTLCTLLVLAAYWVKDVYTVVGLFTLGAFWGTFGGVSGYTVATEFGGTRVGVVFATMNMAGNVGGTIFPVAIGWAVQATGGWDVAVLAFAGMFAVDAVLWAVLNPKRPLFKGDE